MRVHLTEIELELARTGEADHDVVAHLEACAECRAALRGSEELTTRLTRSLEPLAIPPERKRAVLDLARERAAAIRASAGRRPRRSLRVLAWAVPLAAAAVVALVFLVSGLQPPATPAASESVAVAVPDDINGDGRIDILDAFALARAIEADAAAGDRSDVDRVAMTAVAITKSGGSK
jgi:hypothetical protein